MVHLRALAFNHSHCVREKQGAASDQVVFYFVPEGFVFGGMRSLRSSMACSSLWRRFQKSAQRSPFSFKRAKTVFIFNVSGRKLPRNSRGSRGAQTGA